MASGSGLFARSSPPGRSKLLLLGSPDFRPENLMNRVRSLNLEHVSPARLARPEISHVARASSPVGLRPVRTAAEEATRLALLRRWFFARKPDAGFVLTDFPATLLQALVLDEWLEARDEALNAVLAGPGSDESVVTHYRTLGLLREPGEFAA